MSKPESLMGIAGLCAGALMGYILGTTQAPAQTQARASEPPPIVQASSAIEAANRLYDAGRYAESIPYYQQALRNDPNNPDVSTDLGTALWYSGRPDDALAQFDRSLKVQPNHPQTLFNMGIVRAEGKKDPAGAIDAWQALLTSNPSYPQADKVRALVKEQQAKLP